MKEILHGMATPFAEMWQKSEDLNLKGVRPARLLYVLAYSFELMLYAMRGRFIPTGALLFGISDFMVMYIGHILFSLVIMLLWSKKFKHLIHISIAVLIVGFFPVLFLPDGYPKLFFGVIAWAGLGGCVTSARCGFAFAANNTERIIGVMVMFAMSVFFHFADAFSVENLFLSHILPILLLAGLAVCLFLFKENDFEVKEQSTTADSHGLYWALAFFIAFFTVDGYSWGLIDSSYSDGMLALSVGMTLAGVIFIAVLFLFKKSIWHVWNIYFVLSIIMALMAVFMPQIGSSVPQYFFSGTVMIGWPAALYMLACAQRRFASYKLLKQCTIVFVILSPITTLLDEVVNSLFPHAAPAITLIVVLVISVGFLMASPISYKHLFSTAWIDDLHKTDMTLYSEEFKLADQINKDGALGLTPREMEIFTLLLTEMPFKQISITLNISENTVRFHSKNLYRKLNVQSRTELFAQHGKSTLTE